MANHVAVRPVRAIAGEATIDEPRVRVAQRIVVHAEPFGRGRSEPDHEHIGPLCELAEHFQTRFAL